MKRLIPLATGTGWRRSTRLLLPALLLLTSILSGCGGQAGSGTTLTIWYSTDDPVERVWSQELARSFERTERSVQVRLIDYSFEDLNTKLQLALSAGDPPDLAYVTPRGPGIPAYVAAHQLRDLSPAARAHGWPARLQPGLLAAYNRPFQFLGARRGSVVGVPTALAAVTILYNARLLLALHLAVPRTLGKFESDLERAKRSGYTPIGIGNGDGWLGDDWYLTLVNALVPPAALAPEGRLSPRFSFQRPPFLRAGTILERWAQRGYFTHDFGGLDAQEGLDLFFHGRTLFQLISSSQNSQLLQDERQTHVPVGVFAFPRSRGGGVLPVSGYEGWVVPRAARHPRQAIAFIDHLLSSSTARFLLRQGVLPAHRGAGEAAPAGRRWQEGELQALRLARPGIYLDAAPVPNLNGTMEANVQLLLQGYERPQFLTRSLQDVYTSHGNSGSTARIDGEF